MFHMATAPAMPPHSSARRVTSPVAMRSLTSADLTVGIAPSVGTPQATFTSWSDSPLRSPHQVSVSTWLLQSPTNACNTTSMVISSPKVSNLPVSSPKACNVFMPSPKAGSFLISSPISSDQQSSPVAQDVPAKPVITRTWQPKMLGRTADEEHNFIVSSKASPLPIPARLHVLPHSPQAACFRNQVQSAPQQCSVVSALGSKPATKVLTPVLNPLAVGFSQPRIKPEFMDGSSFDDAIAACHTEPCDVDASGRFEWVLLSPPFPAIEVVPWRPKLRKPDGTALKDPTTGAPRRGKERWFTLDNRRLHCLQRAAIEAWPKLCYVPVRIMKDLPEDGHALRKFKTTSEGASIALAGSKDSIQDATLWDWYAALQSRCTDEDGKLEKVKASIEADSLSVKEHTARTNPTVSAAAMCGRPAATPKNYRVSVHPGSPAYVYVQSPKVASVQRPTPVHQQTSKDIKNTTSCHRSPQPSHWQPQPTQANIWQPQLICWKPRWGGSVAPMSYGPLETT